MKPALVLQDSHTAMLVGPARYSSKHFAMPRVSKLEPRRGGWRGSSSLRHRMPFDSRNEGSDCVSMTW